MHKLIARLVQEGPQKNLVSNMASGIHHFCPISPRNPMLIEHRPSHLTKATIFPLNYTILTSHIGRRKLVFETQITTKGFETRVLKFTTIVATNSSNNISMSLVLQPQEQIPHKTKRPPLSAKKRSKYSENSRPRSQGHTISHPPSTNKLDQPSPYGTARMASLS
jgi:hypothetical protein